MANIAVDGAQRHSKTNDLLLQETNHRCSNDLQLVVSLLALESKRHSNPEVGLALHDAMERVAMVARARKALHSGMPRSLATTLREICEALHVQAEPRAILIEFESDGRSDGLPQRSITTLALVVNELVTNAIKHAFSENQAGSIQVTAGIVQGAVSVTVNDDGRPFAPIGSTACGTGIGLARRMMASIDGLFITPEAGAKQFELRIPLPRAKIEK